MALGTVDYKPKEWDRRPEQRVKDTGDLGRPNRGPLGDTTPNGTKQHLVRMITVHARASGANNVPYDVWGHSCVPRGL